MKLNSFPARLCHMIYYSGDKKVPLPWGNRVQGIICENKNATLEMISPHCVDGFTVVNRSTFQMMIMIIISMMLFARCCSFVSLRRAPSLFCAPL